MVLYKNINEHEETKKFLSLSINVREFARKKTSAGLKIMKGVRMAEKYKSRDRVWENMDTLQEVWEFRGGRRKWVDENFR